MMNPCLVCGCNTSNGNLICSEACFEQYANDNADLYDADTLASVYGSFDDDESLCDDGWYDEA